MRFSDEKKTAYVAAAQMLATFVAAIMKMTVSKFIETVKKINAGEVEAPNLATKLRTIRASREVRDIFEVRIVRGELPLELHEVLFPRPKDGTRDNGLGYGFVGVLREVFLKTGGASEGVSTGLAPVLPMRLSPSIYETLVELRKKHPTIWQEMGFEPAASRRITGSSIEDLIAESQAGKETTAAALWRIAQASHQAWVAKRSSVVGTNSVARQNAPLVASSLADDLFAGVVEEGGDSANAALTASAVADFSHERISDGIEFQDFQDFTADDNDSSGLLEEAVADDDVVLDLDAELAIAAASASVVSEPTAEDVAIQIEASKSGIPAVRNVLLKKLRGGEIGVREALQRAKQYNILIS